MRAQVWVCASVSTHHQLVSSRRVENTDTRDTQHWAPVSENRVITDNTDIMSQYPMYPTQLSYLPTAPMYGYPANYPYMLPAAMYSNTQGAAVQSQASLVQVQQQQQTQIQSQVSGETGDTSKETGARPESVTVSSSVGEESEDRSEYIEELTREKEALGETGNSHAKRLIDRGNNDT